VDTTWWTRTATDAVAGILALPTTATTPDRWMPGWTLRRAAAVWVTNQPGQRSNKDYQDGPGHRRDRQLQVLLRRPAGASAHCCPQTDRVERRADGEASSVMAGAVW
jgi:hypothetical protein